MCQQVGRRLPKPTRRVLTNTRSVHGLQAPAPAVRRCPSLESAFLTGVATQSFDVSSGMAAARLDAAQPIVPGELGPPGQASASER